MRLLFLTPQLPYPPHQGTAIRNWGLIRQLAQRHEITLLSFAEPGQGVHPTLAATCAQVHTEVVPQRTRWARLRTLFSPQPDLARRLWSPAFAQKLAEILQAQRYDWVQLEGLELAPYTEVLQTLPMAQRPRLVYDAHNAETVIQQRALATDRHQPRRWPAAFYSWLQIPRLTRLEAQLCQTAQLVTCVSGEDAAALQHHSPKLKPLVIPNGIDVAAYAAIPAAAVIAAGTSAVFTGKMDYRPNIDAVLWFSQAIWPQVRAAYPQAQFVVVGQKPTATLQQLHGTAGIVITGAVPDARPYIAQASVYVAPLRMGGGTRFKLLEAMALARPIVSTTVGAEGFAVQSGHELWLADKPTDFAQAIVNTWQDPKQAQMLGACGQQFVAQSYDWQTIVPRLEAALKN